MEWWREHGSDDVARFHTFLVERPGVDAHRLVAGGASCGVLMAVDVAERFPSAYRALALLSGPLDKRGYDYLFHSSLPVFVAVSGNDTPFTQYAHQQVDRSTNEASEFHLLDRAGHGTDMLAGDPTLGGKVVAWFRRWVGAPPPPIETRRSDP